MGENFDNAGLEEDENSDSTEDEVDSIVQSPSVAVRALEDDIDDAGLLRGMLQVSENSGEVEKSEFVWSSEKGFSVPNDPSNDPFSQKIEKKCHP